MQLSSLIIASLFYLQSVAPYSPATFKTLAALNNQKAKAVAKALNLHTKAYYRALAKSRASNGGIRDHRIIRDSNANVLHNQGDHTHGPDLQPLEAQTFDETPYWRSLDEVEAPQFQKWERLGSRANFENVPEVKDNHDQYLRIIKEISKMDSLPPTLASFNEDDQQHGGGDNLDENGNLNVEHFGANFVECPECQAALSLQEAENEGVRSADPHFHPHMFTHTHSHSHSIQPLDTLHTPVQIPTGQVVAPGVNVHVIQNQNAAVSPQFAQATVQPGFGTAIVNPMPVIHGPETGFSHNRGLSININRGHRGGAFRGIPQSVLSDSNHVVTDSGIPGTTVVQTQSVQGMREAEPLDHMDTLGEPRNDLTGNFNNEKVLMPFNQHIQTPEYERYHDLSKPQNRQGIVRYLESQQSRVKAFVPSIEQKSGHNPRLLQPFDGNNEYVRMQVEPQEDFDNGQSRSDFQEMQNFENWDKRSGETNFENQKLGTFHLDSTQLEPMPTLPGNFVELNPEEQRQSVTNILDTEQRNIQNILSQIDKQQRRSQAFARFLEQHDVEHFDNDPRPHENEENLHQMEDSTHFDNLNPNRDSMLPGLHTGVQNFNDQTLGNNRQGNMEERWTQTDHNFGTPPKFIENGHGVQERIGMPQREEDSILGNLFEVPMRYSEDYLRRARSLNRTTIKQLDELLLKERELINDLKKNAKHDEDLMMIGYIGDSLISDFERKINGTKRRKREVGGRNLPVNRLFTDPRARLDIPKTLENLGAITKSAFEHQKAPLYHVRNMVGSAQNAVLATMKIPTKNFLIPSDYEIVNTKEGIENLGALNPSLLDQHSNHLGANDGIIDTFNKVGSAVRGSVLSGQEALGHVGEIANHAKNAIHSSANFPPRMTLKQIAHITRDPTKKAIIIAPRIFDIAEDNGQQENVLGAPQPNFVGVGHLFDAVGLSSPNARDVEFEKIIIEPKGSFADFDIFHSPKPPTFLKKFRNILDSVRVEQAKEDDIIGSTLNSLDEVRASMGADSVKDLLQKMKQGVGALLMKEILMKKEQTEKGGLNSPVSATKFSPKSENPLTSQNNIHDPMVDLSNTKQKLDDQQNIRNSRNAENQQEPDQDWVQASFFPPELMHPFMGRHKEHETQQPLNNMNGDGLVASPNSEVIQNQEVFLQNADPSEVDRRLDQVLGAINPMMFERMFKETLQVKDGNESPHSMFQQHSHSQHQVDEDHNLGTSMIMTDEMLTPFMGHATEKMKHDFFDKYNPENSQYVEFEEAPEASQWAPLDPYKENSYKYNK